MRLAFLGLIPAFILIACERAEESADHAPAPAPRVEIPVSDELPGLAAPATGIAFWEHPALSFNSMMIVANAEGAVAYNIEDGTEVARIDGVDASGAAVTYVGRGDQAAGVLALHDRAENAFRFYGVDNASRALPPIEGGPETGSAIRGFCFGRAETRDAPTLFVLRSGAISIFNFEAAPDGLALVNELEIDAVGNLAACAVNRDGVLIAATDDGVIYRIDGPNAYADPLAETSISETGGLALLYARLEGEDGAASVSGQILLFDEADGAIHVFDSDDGTALGVAAASATAQIDGVSSGSTMAATGANLGALYRNGVIAIGTETEGDATATAAVRLIPYNGLMNALSLPESAPVSPRGANAAEEEDNTLIRTEFTPE